MKIFIGYDRREDIAYEVAKRSILDHMDAEVIALRLEELREMGLYWREPDPLSSTEFSFSRFLVPALCNFRGRALFMDCDFLVRKSLKSLLQYINPDIAAWVVKHDYKPTALTKMNNQAQRLYPRKNWSSFMWFNCDHPMLQALTPDIVNTETGMYLHRFMWATDKVIGQLPITYNYLEGWHTRAMEPDPACVHFTEGGPWFDTYQNVEYAHEWKQVAGRVRASER